MNASIGLVGSIDASASLLYNFPVPLYIANQEAEDLARELAAATGETITDVVLHALRDRRDLLRKPTKEERKTRLLELSDRTAAIIAGRTIDVDDLYDEDGLPK